MNRENTIFDKGNTQRGNYGESTVYDAGKGSQPQSERTVYDAGKGSQPQGERTVYDSHPSPTPTIPNRPQKGSSVARNAAIGFGSAAVAGAAVALFSSSAIPGHGGSSDGTADGPGTGDNHPAWTDGSVPVASGVNDDMTFAEAFNAARDEVGAGGAFEWHGYIYSTYTEDEWNSMSQEQRDDYGSHFSWQGTAPDAGTTGQHDGGHTGGHADASVTAASDGGHATPAGHGEGPDYAATAGNHTAEEVTIDDDSNVVACGGDDGDSEMGESEVQVLSVSHDAENDINVADVVVSGTQGVLVDINNDNTFDVIAIDVNGDGNLSEDEVFDISGQNITVDDALASIDHGDAQPADTDMADNTMDM